MKKTLLFVCLTIGLLSCTKEHLVPEPMTLVVSYEKYVLSNDSGYSEQDTVWYNHTDLKITLPILNGDLDTIDLVSTGINSFSFDHLVKGQSGNIKVYGTGYTSSNTLYLTYNHKYIPTNTIIHNYNSIYSKY